MATERMYIEREIGPEEARNLLALRSKQRSIKYSKVYQFTQDMRHGRWKFNPQPICIDVNENLIDGQHRLAAVLRSGTTQTFLIAYGQDPELFYVLDRTNVRNVVDPLQADGHKNTTGIAATARDIYRVLAGVECVQSRSTVGSDDDVRSVLAMLPRIEESFEACTAPAFRQVCPSKSTCAAAFTLMDYVDPKLAKDFMDRIVTGVGIKDKSDPAHLVRIRLGTIRDALAARRLGKRPNVMMDREEILAVLFKGFNYFRKGKKVTALRYRRTIEPFPVIQGVPDLSSWWTPPVYTRDNDKAAVIAKGLPPKPLMHYFPGWDAVQLTLADSEGGIARR